MTDKSFSGRLFWRFKLTLFGMCSHVGGLGKALATIGMWTFVGLESGVIVEMCLQVMFLGESLRANRTGEGFYSCEGDRTKIILVSELNNVYNSSSRFHLFWDIYKSIYVLT